jgi:hypothetical protein
MHRSAGIGGTSVSSLVQGLLPVPHSTPADFQLLRSVWMLRAVSLFLRHATRREMIPAAALGSASSCRTKGFRGGCPRFAYGVHPPSGHSRGRVPLFQPRPGNLWVV